MKKIIKLISLTALCGVKIVQGVGEFNNNCPPLPDFYVLSGTGNVGDALHQLYTYVGPSDNYYSGTLDVVQHPDFHYIVHIVDSDGKQAEFLSIDSQNTLGFESANFNDALRNNPDGIALGITHTNISNSDANITGLGVYTLAWQAYSLKDASKIPTIQGSLQNQSFWKRNNYIGFLGYSDQLAQRSNAPTNNPTLTWYKIIGKPPYTKNNNCPGLPSSITASSLSTNYAGTLDAIQNQDFDYIVKSVDPSGTQTQMLVIDNQTTQGFKWGDFNDALFDNPGGIALGIAHSNVITDGISGWGTYTLSWQAYSLKDGNKISSIQGSMQHASFWNNTYIGFLTHTGPTGDIITTTTINEPTLTWYMFTGTAKYKAAGSIASQLPAIFGSDNVTALLNFIKNNPTFNMKKAYPAAEIAPGWASNFEMPLLIATAIYGAEKCMRLLLMLGIVDINAKNWTDKCTALSLLQNNKGIGYDRNKTMRNLLIQFGATT